IVETGGLTWDQLYTTVNRAIDPGIDAMLAVNGSGAALIGNDAGNVFFGSSDAGVNTLTGGAGDDHYHIDGGDVVVEVDEAGTDTVYSWASQTLASHVEHLVLGGPAAINGTGNGSANHLTGNTQANRLAGGGGDDTLDGGAGSDTLVGGAGADRLIGDGTAVAEVSGQDGDYILVDYQGSIRVLDRVAGRDGFDHLTGVATLRYASGAATVSLGYARNPLDYIAAYPDLMAAFQASENAGYQHLTQAGVAEGRTITFDPIGYLNANPDLAAAFGSNTTDTAVLRAATTHYIITGAGEARGATLLGGAGYDIVRGGAGGDWLDGKGGADDMTGETGNDTYVVDHAGDIVNEAAGAGVDTVRAGIAYTLGAAVENLTLTGTASLAGTGNALANLLLGNSGANHLAGQDGDDTLDGGAGADTLEGGAGNDTYWIDNAADQVVETSVGTWDQVYTAVSRAFDPGIDAMLAVNGSGAALTGNGDPNVLFGSSDANVNTLTGGAGDDHYHLDGGDVVVEADGGGTDTAYSWASLSLAAHVEHLALGGPYVANGTGNSLANQLTGNAQANILDGNGGADTLAGGAGNDTLIGGSGADRFDFRSTPDALGNFDVIEDFVAGTDKIGLDHAVYAQLAAGSLGAGNFVANPTGSAADANDVVLFNTTTGQLAYDADGSGAGVAVPFAVLLGQPVLTAADFAVL
ncbi:MAG: calcium-binding protein, partial [Burkholderiales bacterium]|nr:calcium-binding protein [Burkholderiales bacterium]